MITPLDELLREVAHSIPHLPGARCRGQHQIFDETDDPDTIEACLYVCERCPVLADCQAFVDSLKPSQRPRGVCAGKLRRDPRTRRKAAA
jgi:hypothetical protein